MKLKIKVPWGHVFIPLWGKDKHIPLQAFLLSLILCVPEIISFQTPFIITQRFMDLFLVIRTPFSLD